MGLRGFVGLGFFSASSCFSSGGVLSASFSRPGLRSAGCAGASAAGCRASSQAFHQHTDTALTKTSNEGQSMLKP